MPSFLTSIVGTIEFTEERKSHILSTHPELKPHVRKFTHVLKNPDEIRISRIDQDVLLFYKYFARIKGGKYMAITVKTGQRNFILTAYLTDKIRAGEPYEKEKSL